MATRREILNNVQGDVLIGGIPKQAQSFFLFTIRDEKVKDFCLALKQVAALIANGTEIEGIRRRIQHIKDRHPDGRGEKLDNQGRIQYVAANIAFSFVGLKMMESFLPDMAIDALEADGLFANGMKKDAQDLGDPVNGAEPSTWDDTFMKPDKIHGVVLVAGNNAANVKRKLQEVGDLLTGLVKEVATIDGKVRPGDMRAHEHFGFRDGVSQPDVRDVALDIRDSTTDRFKEANTIGQEIILIGRGANVNTTWLRDGTFMCFRKLAQDVASWNAFVSKPFEGRTDIDAATIEELEIDAKQIGARMVGRWPSGCPLMKSPFVDNETLGTSNAFDYKIAGNADLLCPRFAHVRKTNPRSDLIDAFGRGALDTHRIIRSGIPYGPEFSDKPNAERGLLFVSYQSSIKNGFKFVQRDWANAERFFSTPEFKEDVGLDPVIGQSNTDGIPASRLDGLIINDLTQSVDLPGVNRFVTPKGGEYFFMPSMSALRGVMSTVVAA